MSHSYSINDLHSSFKEKLFSPRELIVSLSDKIHATTDNPVWIRPLSREELEPYILKLEAAAIAEDITDDIFIKYPLYGIPFAIKDNIDLAGIPTTAACLEFSYTPDVNAVVVEHLIAAGAVPMGKTNMDQFATGLVGVRSPKPWGPCKNALNEKIISGGSSSGSAVALALGQVSFSLGTDTAGSGRVPAALNNVLGLKPSKGMLSTTGVVPACRSLDCVSIFALDSNDANTVFDVAAVFDKSDAYSRRNPYANGPRYYSSAKSKVVLGVPRKNQLEFYGDDESAALFYDCLGKLKKADIELVEIDFEPFTEAAKLLYEGPWVAERYLATESLIEKKPDAMLPVIRKIIGGGALPSARDAFAAEYKLRALEQRADTELEKVDAIVTPTVPRYYSIDQVEENPIELNSCLGYYTNFMNLLDCSAVAMPVAHYKNGVGFGVTLFDKAFQDKKLLSIVAHLKNYFSLKSGLGLSELKPLPDVSKGVPKSHIDLVVCGAHLDGLGLNWQLKERGAKLVRSTYTSENYSFYALPGGPPKRPALVRNNEGGNKIEVEVWRMPQECFGSFVAEIPAPLGIGKVELIDGSWYSGFICDKWGLVGAENISVPGSWREYLKSM